MRQRVRCKECRHWADALLVWAAGDCCPNCNAPMSGLDRDERSERVESGEFGSGEGRSALRPGGELPRPGYGPQSGMGRVSGRPLSRGPLGS